jgi:hypothetical protein
MLRWFLLCLLLCTVAVGCASGRGEAACAVTFFVEAKPTQVAPGETFRLRGGPFFVGCDDHEQVQPDPPDRDIRISFHQGGRTWELDTVAASGEEENYTLKAELKVPSEAEPGPAVVIAASDDGRGRDRIWVVSNTSG